MTSETARHIAARVWCDPEMQNCVMDPDKCEEIAAIIDQVLNDRVSLADVQIKPSFGRDDRPQYYITLRLDGKYFTVVIPASARDLADTIEEAQKHPAGLNLIFEGHYE